MTLEIVSKFCTSLASETVASFFSATMQYVLVKCGVEEHGEKFYNNYFISIFSFCGNIFFKVAQRSQGKLAFEKDKYKMTFYPLFPGLPSPTHSRH